MPNFRPLDVQAEQTTTHFPHNPTRATSKFSPKGNPCGNPICCFLRKEETVLHFHRFVNNNRWMFFLLHFIGNIFKMRSLWMMIDEEEEKEMRECSQIRCFRPIANQILCSSISSFPTATCFHSLISLSWLLPPSPSSQESVWPKTNHSPGGSSI